MGARGVVKARVGTLTKVLTMKNLILAAAVMAVTGLAGAGAAAAAEATASVNVRSGPGTAYTIVDQLYAGERVDVAECASNGWCLVAHNGPDGWVSANYLTNREVYRESRSTTRAPAISFSFSFGRGNGFSMGGPPRGSSRDQVCLVTFQNSSQVAGGADADVVRAQVMSRGQAERLDRPNDRRAIYDYGTNAQTRSTCNYLDNLN